MRDDDKLDEALGGLWASFVAGLSVDLPNHQVLFDLSSFKDEVASGQHSLVFDGVSAFFFVNGKGEARFRTTAWANAELSEADYFRKPLDHILHKSDKEGTPQYNANPNFYLELWGSVFMLEAKAIIIDGVRYEASAGSE